MRIQVVVIIIFIILILFFRRPRELDTHLLSLDQYPKFKIKNNSKINQEFCQHHKTEHSRMFNCGICYFNGQFIIMTRVTNGLYIQGNYIHKPYYSECCVMISPTLQNDNKEWNWLSFPKKFYSNKDYKGVEDIRPFNYRGAVWCLGTPKIDGYSQHILFPLKKPSKYIQLRYNTNRDQKNWYPFPIDSELFFIYGVYPRLIILKCTFSTGKIARIADSPSPVIENITGDLIRGAKILFKLQNAYVGVANVKIGTPYYLLIFFILEVTPKWRIVKWSPIYSVKVGKYFTYLFDVCEYDARRLVFSFNIDDDRSNLYLIDKEDILKCFKS